MNTNFIDPSKFTSFISVGLFITWYDRFLGLFPAQTHWFVSAIILFSIVAAFFVLIRTNWLFILVLILLVPVLYPVLKSFFAEIWTFVMYLWNIASSGVPKT